MPIYHSISIGQGGYEFNAPTGAPPESGCALVAGSGSGTSYNLGWSARPVLIEPVVDAGTNNDYLSPEGWKSIPSSSVAVGDITGFGAGVAAFLATPSSANLRTAVTDETGSGALVFANTPTLVTPNIGAATGSSLDLTGVITVSSLGGRLRKVATQLFLEAGDGAGTWLSVIRSNTTGTVVIGNATVGHTCTINSPTLITSLLQPAADNTHDFGTGALRWKDSYFAGAMTAGSATFGSNVVINGTVSCPQNTSSERFGAGANCADVLSVAVGNSATCGVGCSHGVAIGYGATVAGAVCTAIGYGAVGGSYASVAIGWGASSGWHGVAIGYGAQALTAYGNGGVAIGRLAVAHDGSVAIGAGAATTAAGQCVIEPSLQLIAGAATFSGAVTGKQAFFQSTATTDVTLTAKAVASQTANVQEWQNSDGTLLGYMTTTTPRLVLGSAASGVSLRKLLNGFLGIYELNGTTLGTLLAGNATIAPSQTIFASTLTGASTIMAVGMAAQTAPVIEIRTSANVPNIQLYATGAATFNGNVVINGTVNGVALTTGGSATQYLSGTGAYSTPPVTAPAGSNTQLQFNNSGAFGASASLNWNGTTLTTNALFVTNGITGQANLDLVGSITFGNLGGRIRHVASQAFFEVGDAGVYTTLIRGHKSTGAVVIGNATVGHACTINSPTLTTSLIQPAANNTYDFGTAGSRWKDGYFAGSITASAVTLSGNLSATGTATFGGNLQQGYAASITPSARWQMTAIGARISEVGDGAGAWQELIAETYDAGGRKLGFYGTTAIAKQTYTTGDGADALATLLHNLGLITKV